MQFEPQEQQNRVINADPREQQYQNEQGYWNEQRPYEGQKLRPTQRHRRRSTRKLLPIILLCILLGAGWGLLHAPIFSSQNTLPPQTFTLTSHGSLTLIGGSSDFHIHTGQTNAIIIQETDHNIGLDNQRATATYRQNGDAITLSSNNGSNWLGNYFADFDITVPASVDLQATTGSGNMEIDGVDGALAVNTGSGDLTLTNINSSTVTAETSSGDIHATTISGREAFTTGSGDITIREGNLRGSSTLKTNSGDISLEGSLDPTGDYTVRTDSGDVDLTLPTDSAFTLTTSTGSGDVHNDFDATSVGQGTRAPVSINTDSGDINIHKQ